MKYRRSRSPGGFRVAQVRRDTAISVLGSFTAQGMVLVSGVLVARMLGVENRGYLALLWLVSLVLGQLGTMGLPLAATYWIAKDPPSAQAVVHRLLRPAAIQAPILIGLQVVALLILVRDKDNSVQLAAVLTLPLIPALLAHQYALAIFQGQQRFGAFNIFRSLPATLYAVAIAVLFVASIRSLPLVALTFTSVVVLAASLALCYALAGLPRSPPKRSVPGRKEMVRFGLKGLFGSISPLDTFQLDQAVVGLFISPAALGLYVVGLAFTNLPRFVAQSVGFVAFPHVAKHSNFRAARRAMWKFGALTLVACGAIVGALEVTAGKLVPLFFGREFYRSSELARILLISALLVGVRRVLADGARGAGYPGLGTLAEIVAWATLFPAVAILAPAAGVQGVAIALAISAGAGIATLVGALTLAGHSPPALARPHRPLAEDVATRW